MTPSRTWKDTQSHVFLTTQSNPSTTRINMVQTQTMNNKSIVDPAAANKVFISYSWENPDVRTAVHELATRLEKDGVKALLDEKDLHPGQDLNHFMLSMVRDKTITKILLINIILIFTYTNRFRINLN